MTRDVVYPLRYLIIVLTSQVGCRGEYSGSEARMRSKRRSGLAVDGADQSRAPTLGDLPFGKSTSFALTLACRFDTMASRSVRWTDASGNSAAAAMPSKPVPEPSSSIRGESVDEGRKIEGRKCLREGKRRARRYEASQVLWPKLSDVREGSLRRIWI